MTGHGPHRSKNNCLHDSYHVFHNTYYQVLNNPNSNNAFNNKIVLYKKKIERNSNHFLSTFHVFLLVYLYQVTPSFYQNGAISFFN